MSSVDWRTMYKVESHGSFIFPCYKIIFDDTSVIIHTTFKAEAKNICKALNGAYNLGRFSAIVEQEKEK